MQNFLNYKALPFLGLLSSALSLAEVPVSKSADKGQGTSQTKGILSENNQRLTVLSLSHPVPLLEVIDVS